MFPTRSCLPARWISLSIALSPGVFLLAQVITSRPGRNDPDGFSANPTTAGEHSPISVKRFRYSVSMLFHMSERKLKRHRWYFFEIFLRSLEEAQWSFVGKMIAEDEQEDKLVLQDQDEYLYFLRLINDTYIDGDFVRIRSEWAGSGETVDEGWLKEIGEEDFQPPKVLTKLDEVGDSNGLRRDNSRFNLANLRKAVRIRSI
jgi:hypothetical protein